MPGRSFAYRGRPRCAYVAPVLYFAVALVCAVAAAQRLAVSTEMPGLAAIELVVLAMPWSLLLEAPGWRQAGWTLMTVIVLGGVVLNTLGIYAMGRAIERWWHAA